MLITGINFQIKTKHLFQNTGISFKKKAKHSFNSFNSWSEKETPGKISGAQFSYNFEPKATS